MAEENGAPREFADDIKALGDQIVALTVGKAVELGDYLEEVHGIKPAGGGAVMMAAGPAVAEEEDEVQTEFTVELEGLADAGAKIKVIKVVRELTSLGLKEAKDVVEKAPQPVKEGIAKDEAEAVKKKLEEAGAKVKIK